MGTIEFERCGIQQGEFEKLLMDLEIILGEEFTKIIRNRSTLSVWDIILVQNRCNILENLKYTKGLNKVIKLMRSKNGDLINPKGDWFQLILGNMLIHTGELIEFEQKIGNNIVDISLRSGSICIECKAFDGNKKMEGALKYISNSSNENKINKSEQIQIDLINFKDINNNKKDTKNPIENISYLISSINPNALQIKIDESKRFLQKLFKQQGQLIEGVCNVKAMDITALNLSPTKLKPYLETFFIDVGEGYKKLSSVLLIAQFPTDNETAQLKGKLKYSLAWIVNPFAEVPINVDLIDKFNKNIQ